MNRLTKLYEEKCGTLYNSLTGTIFGYIVDVTDRFYVVDTCSGRKLIRHKYIYG